MRLPARALALLIAGAAVASACNGASEPGELTIYGPYVGAEADIFEQVIASYERSSGASVSYVGSGDFQTDFDERVNAADLADITILPQFTLLDVLVDDDHIVPMGPKASEKLIDTVGEFWSAVVAPDGTALAVPYRFVVKSIVWYRADVFEEEGYEVPETLAELTSLTREIIVDGHTPWCAGMDTAGTTGWWATDWIEDLVVRRAGGETYWSWTDLQTPFTDGAIVGAMMAFQDLTNTQGAFNGGPQAVLTTRVENAIDPMFDETPGCLMHKQGSFQPIWLPDGAEFGSNGLDVFPLPGVRPGGPPMLISGELVAATSNNPMAQDFLEFLLTDAGFEPWLEAGGSLVARADPSENERGNELDVRLNTMVAEAETIVLDASDLMPERIGTGVFYQGMIDLVAGRPPSEVAATIQDEVDLLNTP